MSVLPDMWITPGRLRINASRTDPSNSVRLDHLSGAALSGFGVEVVSVGSVFAREIQGVMHHLVVAIVPDRGGKSFVPYYLMLDMAQDPFMAHVYRTGLIIALEEFFGRVQIFGDTLTLAKYCEKERPSEHATPAATELMRNRGLN